MYDMLCAEPFRENRGTLFISFEKHSAAYFLRTVVHTPNAFDEW